MPKKPGTSKPKPAPKPPKPVKDPHGQNRKPDADPGSFDPAGNTANRPKPGPGAKEKAQDVAKKIEDKVANIGGSNVVKPAPKPGSKESNKDKFGFNAKLAGDGGGGFGGHASSPTRSTVYRSPGMTERYHDTAHMGANDGGRLSGGFSDPDLVGSRNDIDEFDGSTFSGGEGEGLAGGGGGTGSSTAGREAVGLVNLGRGESVEETVYGVKRRRGKIRVRRGE